MIRSDQTSGQTSTGEILDNAGSTVGQLKTERSWAGTVKTTNVAPVELLVVPLIPEQITGLKSPF